METCKECGREFKNLGAHMRWAHPGKTMEQPAKPNGSSSSPKSAPERESAPPKKHVFASPHASGLAVIIKPSRVGYEPGPNGTKYAVQLPGKRVTFINGQYITDDQEIIDYFNHTGDYSAPGMGYQDRRYPVVDLTTIGDKAQ